jgi:hypothetical protein
MEKRTTIVDGSPTPSNMRGTRADCCTHLVNIFLLILIFIVGCEPEVVFPQHLLGVWRTSAPKYADRWMKINERTVVYGIGKSEIAVYAIERIDIKQGKDGTVYTFYLVDAEGGKDTLALTYRPASGGTLRIEHSVGIWKKDKSGGAR